MCTTYSAVFSGFFYTQALLGKLLPWHGRGLENTWQHVSLGGVMI